MLFRLTAIIRCLEVDRALFHIASGCAAFPIEYRYVCADFRRLWWSFQIAIRIQNILFVEGMQSMVLNRGTGMVSPIV